MERRIRPNAESCTSHEIKSHQVVKQDFYFLTRIKILYYCFSGYGSKSIIQIKEFQRLKDEEARSISLEWNFQRTLAKVNYRIHTDAIKERLVPPQLTTAQIVMIYATEADLLNVALLTAAQWRLSNPSQQGNMRDSATLEQLVVLSNLESINSVLIHQGLLMSERLAQLNAIAITQMRSLVHIDTIKVGK